ncbi:MAG: acyltransferase [Patescibacteria group bacterium]|jgi:peptidoglycan/LPS O-acetylase OafA/YrhL
MSAHSHKIPGRNRVLDGLRGYAALMVAVGHSFITIKNSSLVDEFIYTLVNGGVAVSIFFLLSGFVLGESLARDTTASFFLKSIKFYIKRLFRIYPVFLLQILLLSLFLIKWPYQHFPAASAWSEYWFNFPITFKEVLSNLIFRSTSLGGVTWTLKAEIIGSFFLPLFYIISSRTHKYVDLCIIALLILLSPIFHVSREVSFLYVFYAGLTLPKWKGQFENIRLKGIWLALATFGLFATAITISSLSIDVDFPFVRHIPLVLFLGLLVYKPAAYVSDVLLSKAFQFLGRISYSFYLFHFLVLYITIRLLFNVVDNNFLQHYFFHFELLIALGTIALAAGVSYFSYRFVEQPFIALGRKVVGRL